MKSLEQILLDNPPFYASSVTEKDSMLFMFLLEDGRIIGIRKNGENEGKIRNHAALLGLTQEDGVSAEKSFCEQNHALRVIFEKYTEHKGIRGDYAAVFVQIFDRPPNDAQWAALADLYRIKDRPDSFVVWDVASPNQQKPLHGDGSLADFKRLLDSVFKSTVPPKGKHGKHGKRG